MDNDNKGFCLKWNNHQSTLIENIDSLLGSGNLVDCTLAAEGKYIKAHKVVLSACSLYFENLLKEHYDKHPVFILKDVTFKELTSMVEYMYKGEVNISEEYLSAFLKTTDSFQIRGLWEEKSCLQNKNKFIKQVSHNEFNSSSEECKIYPTRKRRFENKSTADQSKEPSYINLLKKGTKKLSESTDLNDFTRLENNCQSVHLNNETINSRNNSLHYLPEFDPSKSRTENTANTFNSSKNPALDGNLENCKQNLEFDYDFGQVKCEYEAEQIVDEINEDYESNDNIVEMDNNSSISDTGLFTETPDYYQSQDCVNKRSYKTAEEETFFTKLYTCNKCNKTYKQMHNLYWHQKYECKTPKRFQCYFCQYHSDRKANLQMHIHSKHKKQSFII